MALAIPATTLELLGVLQAKTAMAVAPAAKVNMQESISSRLPWRMREVHVHVHMTFLQLINS